MECQLHTLRIPGSIPAAQIIVGPHLVDVGVEGSAALHTKILQGCDGTLLPQADTKLLNKELLRHLVSYLSLNFFLDTLVSRGNN